MCVCVCVCCSPLWTKAFLVFLSSKSRPFCCRQELFYVCVNKYVLGSSCFFVHEHGLWQIVRITLLWLHNVHAAFTSWYSTYYVLDMIKPLQCSLQNTLNKTLLCLKWHHTHAHTQTIRKHTQSAANFTHHRVNSCWVVVALLSLPLKIHHNPNSNHNLHIWNIVTLMSLVRDSLIISLRWEGSTQHKTPQSSAE